MDCFPTILTPALRHVGFSYATKYFSTSGWMTYNLIKFLHYLPADNIGSQGLVLRAGALKRLQIP